MGEESLVPDFRTIHNEGAGFVVRNKVFSCRLTHLLSLVMLSCTPIYIPVNNLISHLTYRIQSLGARSHLTHDYPAHTKILMICQLH